MALWGRGDSSMVTRVRVRCCLRRLVVINPTSQILTLHHLHIPPRAQERTRPPVPGKTRDHLVEISARDHHRMPRPLSKVSLRQPTARTQRPLHNPRHHRRANIRCINDMQHGILGSYRPSLQKPRPHGRAQPDLPVGRSNPNNAVRQRNLRRPHHNQNDVTPPTTQRRHGRSKPSIDKHFRLAVSPTRPSC